MITIDNTKVKSEQAGKEVTFCDYLLQIAKHIPYQQGLTRENIKLEPVILEKDFTIPQLLNYYMGKNTPERQKFIIENLIIEKDIEETLLA